MSWEARQEHKRAIQRAIGRRQEETAASIRQAPAITAPSLLEATLNHRINGGNTQPNDLISHSQATDNTASEDDGWTLVTRKKTKSLHKDRSYTTGHTTINNHAWLWQQRRCFNCFLKGHKKQQCKRPTKCLQCSIEGHSYRQCNNRINGIQSNYNDAANLKGETEEGLNPKKFSAKSAGPKEAAGSFLLQQRAWLLKQGRCLQCFLRGHKKKDCIRQIKCLICKKTGHVSAQCKTPFITASKYSPTHRPINTTPQTQQDAKGKQKATHTTTHPFTSMANNVDWATMDLMDPDELEAGRMESMRVFLPPRGPLRMVNSFLERSAMVLAGPHQITRYLAHRLTVKLANYFNLQPRDFHVSRVNQNYGDFIVRFPNAHLRDHAVAVCAFTLGPDVQLQLVEWSPGMGVVYDPVTHKARLRLYGLPLHNWNIHDLDIAVSGFGHLLRVENFFTNGNHQEIRILVGCFHPINIPQTIDLSEEPNTTIVHVVLEGWMHDGTADIPRDVTNINDDADPFGGAYQWPAQNFHHTSAHGIAWTEQRGQLQHLGLYRTGPGRRKTGATRQITGRDTGECHTSPNWRQT
ncbi:Zinc finger protein GIS2 [Carex littledalei]|uniref:Zinc finger protein GIS2 n=1 Tax=Carex littledalei TaxID=544730 RepID=A0A833R2J4_9POAL|nr:Zinc finger protein GIS2 [Carex littledalei]